MDPLGSYRLNLRVSENLEGYLCELTKKTDKILTDIAESLQKNSDNGLTDNG